MDREPLPDAEVHALLVRASDLFLGVTAQSERGSSALQVAQQALILLQLALVSAEER